MKRATFTVLSLVIVLSTLTISASAYMPALQESDDNLWQYLPYIKVKDDSGTCVRPEMDYTVEPPQDIDLRERCVREARGNTYMDIFEFGRWTGEFEGTSEEHGKVVIHRSGKVFFWGSVSFEGKVKGKPGTLELFVHGSKPDATSDWQGRWVIVSGTGDLATLRGRGPWWGPGWQGDPTEYGDIHYGGKTRFRTA